MNVLYSSVFLTLMLITPLVVDTSTGRNVTSPAAGFGFSVNVSWWAESVSLALGDLATRALGYDQLQQLYDKSVCVTSLSSDDVNVSQLVLDAAAMFSQCHSVEVYHSICHVRQCVLAAPSRHFGTLLVCQFVTSSSSCRCNMQRSKSVSLEAVSPQSLGKGELGNASLVRGSIVGELVSRPLGDVRALEELCYGLFLV